MILKACSFEKKMIRNVAVCHAETQREAAKSLIGIFHGEWLLGVKISNY